MITDGEPTIDRKRIVIENVSTPYQVVIPEITKTPITGVFDWWSIADSNR